MKQFFCLVFFLVFISGFPFFASAGETMADLDHAKARYAYFEAMRLKGMGEQAAAFEMLRHAIALDSTLAAAYSGIAEYYFLLRDASSGYASLLKAVEYAPENTWYILSAAEYAHIAKDYAQAEKLYAKYLQLKPSDIEVVGRLAEVCLLQGELQQAIDAYNRFEARYGASETTILQKARIYHLSRNREESYAEMERLIAENPRNVSYVVLLGDLYLDAQRFDDAQRMYVRARQIDPDNEAVSLSWLNYYRLNDDWKSYMQLADTVLFHSDLPMDTRMSVLPYVVQILSDDLPRLDTLLTRLCDEFPTEVDLRKIYSEILIHMDSLDRAQEQLEVAIDIDPDEDLWQRLFTLLFQKNDQEAIMAAARRAIEAWPKDARYYVLLATTQLSLGLYDEAVTVSQEALSVPEIASNPLSRSDLYACLGDVAFKRGEWEKSCSYYEKSVGDNPQNYMALNNYSYYLALMGRDLDKAERMSGTVIKANPDNATYLDTYAWIYFRQGRYSLARIYLKKAIDLSQEDSAEMYEHYGDVLAVTGNEEEAVEWWKKAVAAGGNSELLQRKIAEKKYIEDEK